jgi:succinoglycan biosynthesis transport protein ExoP
MNSILRALAARWPLILISTLASLLGGLWVMTTSAPRYQGSARVVLDYIRPDANSGEVIPSKMLDAYLISQLRMLRDQQVAAPAAEILGWMDNPDVLAAYASRPASDTRDLYAWVSALLIPRINAEMVEGSNIMEISYYGESEELSRITADALRTAYIEANVRARQDSARESAEKIQENIERVRAELSELEAIQTQIETETGVVLNDRGVDDASSQLRRMVESPGSPILLNDGEAPPASIAQIAQLEAAINRASQTLGPNNPDLIRMIRQRDVLRAQAASEGATQQARSSAIAAATRASDAVFESLKARVLATREPSLRLRLLQDQINGHLDEFRTLTSALVELRTQQATSVTSLSPIGEAYAEPEPVFPNRLLILAGTGSIGLIFGAILACLAELLGRRVRTQRHLESAAGAALLIELPNMRPRGRKLFRRGRRAGSVEAQPASRELQAA